MDKIWIVKPPKIIVCFGRIPSMDDQSPITTMIEKQIVPETMKAGK